MKISDLLKNENFVAVCFGDYDKTFNGVYCGDLLSMVMGNAQENQLWITVMGNINSIAVAVICNISCIVLSEGCSLDDDAKKRAKTEKIWVLETKLPTFETTLELAKYL
ncbi:MAG: hypothetical protein R3Y09_05670 [Clostridia bacterium]